MNDDVRDPGPRPPDALLDLARPRMRLAEGCRRVEPKCQLRDQALVGVDEAQLARRLAGCLAHDPLDDGALGRCVVLAALARLGDRLEVRPHGMYLGDGLRDRTLDLARDLVRLL